MASTDKGETCGFKKVTLFSTARAFGAFMFASDNHTRLHCNNCVYMCVFFIDMVLAYHKYHCCDCALCHLTCFVKTAVQITAVS